MQFHFPRLGKWKWKRVNIPICLITSCYRGLFALATPRGGNRDAQTHKHTLSIIFHILLAQTQSISACKSQDFISRREWDTPKPSNSLRWFILGVEDAQATTPLMTQRGYSSQHIVILHSGNQVGSEVSHPLFFQAANIHFYNDYTAQTKAADISKLQSESILFFPPGKQTKKDKLQ